MAIDGSVSTWESVWRLLLSEAAAGVNRSIKKEYLIGACAGSIVLARASWEAFINEFIQWRGLPKTLKYGIFRDTLTGILSSLGEPVPIFREGCEWYNLYLVNCIRNEIVHHMAKPVKLGSSPRGIIHKLSAVGIPIAGDVDITWEKRVLVPATARWCCMTVAEAIARLESIEKFRRRAPKEVLTFVSELVCEIENH